MTTWQLQTYSLTWTSCVRVTRGQGLMTVSSFSKKKYTEIKKYIHIYIYNWIKSNTVSIVWKLTGDPREQATIVFTSACRREVALWFSRKHQGSEKNDRFQSQRHNRSCLDAPWHWCLIQHKPALPILKLHQSSGATSVWTPWGDLSSFLLPRGHRYSTFLNPPSQRSSAGDFLTRLNYHLLG